MKLANDEADIDACDMMRKRTAGVRTPARGREGERGAVLVPSSRTSPLRSVGRRKHTYVGGLGQMDCTERELRFCTAFDANL